MIVSTLSWNKVTVKYKKAFWNLGEGPEHDTDIYTRALVSFKQNGLLTIDQPGHNSESHKSVLLARAELVLLTPWEMKWKAFWWSAEFAGTEYKSFIEAEVTCEF